MLPFIRILLLWVTLLFASHSVFEHFTLGQVAARTLAAGIEPNALKFYGFLAAFVIGAYYFCREIENWKRPMPVKVVVAALLAIAFFWSLLGLANLDSRQYEEMASYQKRALAGRLGTQLQGLPDRLAGSVPIGASREEALRAYPDPIATGLEIRRDETAYENFFYWMGPGGDPVGAQVSYSTPPYKVLAVEALPRIREIPTKFESGASDDKKEEKSDGSP